MTTSGASPFAIRGVIEGFYGNPWTHEQRLDLIGFIAARGMNTFVYGPKDDSLVRRDWREPYGGPQLERIGALIDACRRHDVEFVFCLSPGLSIQYANEVDLHALSAKFDSIAAMGVRRFGLLLDDIPGQLQHEVDRATFTDLADAHIALIGHVVERLGPDHGLIVCPTVYYGRGDEDYLIRLGAAMDPRVDLFWSGRAICSPTLDLADAEIFARATGRPPTFWDNYPVNDVAMNWELHIGPYRGRDPELHRSARGVIANAMELNESSKIAFATIADYLAAPDAYDPEASWRRAILDVVGEADADAFTLFADNVRSSCLTLDDAPIVTAALEAFAFRSWQGDRPGAARDLEALADRLCAAAEHLLRGPVRNPALIEECRPWIEAFSIGADALGTLARLAATGNLETDAAATLLPYLARLRDARVRVFGDAVDMTLAEVTGTFVRPGRSLKLDTGGSR